MILILIFLSDIEKSIKTLKELLLSFCFVMGLLFLFYYRDRNPGNETNNISMLAMVSKENKLICHRSKQKYHIKWDKIKYYHLCFIEIKNTKMMFRSLILLLVIMLTIGILLKFDVDSKILESNSVPNVTTRLKVKVCWNLYSNLNTPRL